MNTAKKLRDFQVGDEVKFFEEGSSFPVYGMLIKIRSNGTCIVMDCEGHQYRVQKSKLNFD